MKKYALVTGGSQGIGLGIAITLRDAGYTVAIADYSDTYDQNEGFLNVKCDISSKTDREKLLKVIKSEFGKLDVLVNNAGVGPRTRGDMLDLGEEDYDFVVDINTKGTFFVSQTFAKLMIETIDELVNPTIVNISSMSEYTISVNRPQYCISKAGVGMVTKAFADRLSEYGIHVHEVRPGIIKTNMTATVQDKYDKLFAQGIAPIARWGTPSDIAKAVKALCSDAFPYSTGQVIDVDGGFHIRRL